MRFLKTKAQNFLRTLGLYERIKTSFLYDLFWAFADRRILDQRACEIRFYRNHLCGFRKGDLVFDIGANHGEKTDVFLRLGAKVVSVEPDELNQGILQRRFRRLRLIKRPVCIVGKAVSDKSGLETMWIDAPGSAMNTLSTKWVEALRTDQTRFGSRLNFAHKKEIETVTLDDLIKEHGEPFFIKIDVEGYEPNVIGSLRNPVRYLSFEVNLPEFRPEGMRCLEMLGQLSSEGRFNYGCEGQERLTLERWLGLAEFSPVLRDCQEKSIEVFWKRNEAGT